ncbi:hypothetical protein F5J12DRAFT_960023 [Pisolithus orientalis]|uniref:uncharacterized protein n=1 Tax=Pisolithus orientalis TaxID=936130 RepID=UPI00222566D8|nr:uncharacterized protein F5J12DRAFT_960023 [Pisolithus orientalis]KAI6028500.1 hypothetical protein F5J12DRAFT_960023 [Pisolithus orientalis]
MSSEDEINIRKGGPAVSPSSGGTTELSKVNPKKSKPLSKTPSASAVKDTQSEEGAWVKWKRSMNPPALGDTMNIINHQPDKDVTPSPTPSQRPDQAVGNNKLRHSANVASHKEIDRWKQRVKDLESQRDSLSKQLDELFKIRRTEPEQALEELHVQYEERAKMQDALVRELTSQLARIEPLSRTGQNVALHFLTREAADEEKRAVEQEIVQLRDVIKQRDAVISDQSKRINELQQLGQKNFSPGSHRKVAPTTSRSQQRRPIGAEDPKTEVIKFYEEMSNLLVTNVKFEDAPGSDEQEVTFHCVYTYFEMARREDSVEGERVNEKSIGFTMCIFNGYGGPNGEPISDDDFVHRRIKYTPLHLDKEPDSFVEALSYMGESFTFPCSQQGLFLNSLRDRIGGCNEG